MRWVNAAEDVLQTPTRTAFVTTWTLVWVRSTSAAFATVLAPCTTADVQTFQPATATAKARNWMPSASAAVTATLTRMPTAFATTKTTAWT